MDVIGKLPGMMTLRFIVLALWCVGGLAVLSASTMLIAVMAQLVQSPLASVPSREESPPCASRPEPGDSAIEGKDGD